MGVCFGHRTLVSTALLALVVTLQFISWTSSTVDAAITVKGVKCGSKFCRLDQFCSPHDGHCDDCSSICNETTHNFDLQMCTAQCQDYLHDIRYARSNAYSGELSRLQRQLNLVLVLLIVVLVLLAISHGIRLTKWCKSRGIVSTLLRKLRLKRDSKMSKSGKMAPEDLTHANPNTQSPKVQLRNVPVRPLNQVNRESTVFSIDGASTIQTVSTPISTRYPAEDSTLSYSYDNAGLAITPTIPERPRTGASVFN